MLYFPLRRAPTGPDPLIAILGNDDPLPTVAVPLLATSCMLPGHIK